jgi:hypothetical protein
MPLKTAATNLRERAGVDIGKVVDVQVRDGAATPRFYGIPRVRLIGARIRNRSRLATLCPSGTEVAR